jgi:iron complex outermembrane recepter protein
VGKRAANRANAWYMPSYQTFDLGASYELSDNIRLQANVNNLFNNFGVMSWARAGGFFDSLDRQGLSAASVQSNPDQLFYIVPIQPRSFWLTATLEF